MTDNASTLTPKQRAAIRSLVAGANQVETAAAVGVREATVSDWMRDPMFRAELQAAERDALEVASRQLLGEAEKSIQTLKELHENPATPPAVRVRAATAILDRMTHLYELVQLEQRIAQLESERDQ